MKATVYHAARDVRLETVADPQLRESSDALVRVTHAAICGSDLWFYRGVTQWQPGERTGHEFIGIVEEVGSQVRSIRSGDRVIAPFAISDGTCEFCLAGLQTSCLRGQSWGDDANGAQAQAVRVPLADGTLVRMPQSIESDERKVASALSLTDVLCTGHHGVISAGAREGGTLAVIGDGAVGLCAVLSARRLGVHEIISVGHNAKRLRVAQDFGATAIFDSREPDVAQRIIEATHGGASAVLEAVGGQNSMDLALQIVREGGTVSFVGVPHGLERVDFRRLFSGNVTLRGALAPARAYIPELLEDVLNGSLDASPIFDLQLPLERVAEGYAAMDARTAIKVLLRVS
ncbi:MAG: zinc-binding dehydrogenase [Candidatus Eremiobacteraeota bacterium]|nr:zinc-binding dehydrogenase [Candidatus Eremiobacteraeota bacterium]